MNTFKVPDEVLEAVHEAVMPAHWDKDGYPEPEEAIPVFLREMEAIGWRMVPVEATEEMANAWAALAVHRIWQRLKKEDSAPGAVLGAKQSYAAMIAAAPKVQI